MPLVSCTRSVKASGAGGVGRSQLQPVSARNAPATKRQRGSPDRGRRTTWPREAGASTWRRHIRRDDRRRREGDLRQKAIALARHRLDDMCLLRVVSERLPQLSDDARERIGRDERVPPHAVEELFFEHEALAPFDEEQQHLERLRLQVERGAGLQAPESGRSRPSHRRTGRPVRSYHAFISATSRDRHDIRGRLRARWARQERP